MNYILEILLQLYLIKYLFFCYLQETKKTLETFLH